MATKGSKLHSLYEKLLSHFGRQKWWPGESAFEIVLGAILTQRANWRNVEKAIGNLKRAAILSPDAITNTNRKKLEKLLRPVGFFRQKTTTIRNLVRHLIRHHEGSLDRLFDAELGEIRSELLSLKGIGDETADSILLYAGSKPSFVVDAYTIRIVNRLGLTESRQYSCVKELFENNLPKDTEMYKEFHALLVALGKKFCKTRPYCAKCPLSSDCAFHGSLKGNADSQ